MFEAVESWAGSDFIMLKRLRGTLRLWLSPLFPEPMMTYYKVWSNIQLFILIMYLKALKIVGQPQHLWAWQRHSVKGAGPRDCRSNRPCACRSAWSGRKPSGRSSRPSSGPSLPSCRSPSPGGGSWSRPRGPGSRRWWSAAQVSWRPRGRAFHPEKKCNIYWTYFITRLFLICWICTPMGPC